MKSIICAIKAFINKRKADGNGSQFYIGITNELYYIKELHKTYQDNCISLRAENNEDARAVRKYFMGLGLSGFQKGDDNAANVYLYVYKTNSNPQEEQ